MNNSLIELINRNPNPKPWSEGDNIPWDDPEFSERMLAEHLSQEHDLASRREDAIDTSVSWIFSQILGDRPGRVLDLACGPGLYTSRLARKGCDCVGIDFSPASIRYAKEVAATERLSCDYFHRDLRAGNFGDGFDLAMMIYGQFNVFQRDQAAEILRNAHRALKPEGRIVLEIQTRDQICRAGKRPATWFSAKSGLFSAEPHIVLQENFWHEDAGASVNRFSVIDGLSGEACCYSLSNEAHTAEELVATVKSAGFKKVKHFPSLSGVVVSRSEDLPVITAWK